MISSYSAFGQCSSLYTSGKQCCSTETAVSLKKKEKKKRRAESSCKDSNIRTQQSLQTSSCHNWYIWKANHRGVDLRHDDFQINKARDIKGPLCYGAGNSVVLLYQKEADFHLRQGASLLWPAESNLPGFWMTSTGREACLLRKDKPYYNKTTHFSDCRHRKADVK